MAQTDKGFVFVGCVPARASSLHADAAATKPYPGDGLGPTFFDMSLRRRIRPVLLPDDDPTRQGHRRMGCPDQAFVLARERCWNRDLPRQEIRPDLCLTSPGTRIACLGQQRKQCPLQRCCKVARVDWRSVVALLSPSQKQQWISLF